MKSSIYNTEFKISNGKWLIYNSFNNRFIYLYNDESPLEENVFKSPDCKFTKTLADKGFLVDDEIDEAAILKSRIEALMNDDSTYQLHINPTLDCNLNCWYCYENHIKESSVSEENIGRISLFIKSICDNENLKHLYISFFGGEPLLRFDAVVKKIILSAEEICSNKGVALHFHFTTNGIILSQKMIGFFAERDVRFQITLDGDKGSHNKTRFFKNGLGTFDRIIKNIEMLTMARCHVTARINFTAENIHGVENALSQIIGLKSLNKRFLNVDLQRVWQDFKNELDELLVEKCEKLLKDNGISYSCPMKRNQSLHICYGDRPNYALINYNGDIFKCTARDFKPEDRMGILSEEGKIIWNEEKLDRWNNAKFSHKHCKICKIAPLCAGACRQKNIETKNFNGCLLGYNDDKINDIILDKLLKSAAAEC